MNVLLQRAFVLHRVTNEHQRQRQRNTPRAHWWSYLLWYVQYCLDGHICFSTASTPIRWAHGGLPLWDHVTLTYDLQMTWRVTAIYTKFIYWKGDKYAADDQDPPSKPSQAKTVFSVAIPVSHWNRLLMAELTDYSPYQILAAEFEMKSIRQGIAYWYCVFYACPGILSLYSRYFHTNLITSKKLKVQYVLTSYCTSD